MKKIPLSTITLLIVLLSILTATNNQAFSQQTQKNLSKKNVTDTLIKVTPNEQRVWNRLKNSEQKYRSLYDVKKIEIDSLNKKIDLQDKANTSLIELVTLQQDENILLRKENVNLTDKNKELTLDRDKYKLKTKKRTKALLIAIPISLGTGYILSFFTP